MTNKHIPNKVFADIHFKSSEDQQRKFAEFCEAHGYDLETMTKKDLMDKILEQVFSHNGVETPKKEILETEKNSQPETKKCPELVVSPLDYDCHYRAYNPKTGKFYCDGREIDPYVCMNRHGRFASMEKRCYPKGMTFRRPRKPRGSQDREESNSEQGVIYRGSPAGHTSRTW